MKKFVESCVDERENNMEISEQCEKWFENNEHKKNMDFWKQL